MVGGKDHGDADRTDSARAVATAVPGAQGSGADGRTKNIGRAPAAGDGRRAVASAPRVVRTLGGGASAPRVVRTLGADADAVAVYSGEPKVGQNWTCYAVHRGRKCGVFMNYADVLSQTHGFKGAQFKGAASG
jgi:hypothetical protein